MTYDPAIKPKLFTVIGALLGTQNGREVEIVNTFELSVVENNAETVDQEFLVTRRDLCACVFLANRRDIG
jgi:hypothetical protein